MNQSDLNLTSRLRGGLDYAGPAFAGSDLVRFLINPRRPLQVVFDETARKVGLAADDPAVALPPTASSIGRLPPLYPEWLGDRRFIETHGIRFPYVVGEMARGIATANMVIAAARVGVLGFFGAAGLALTEVSFAIDQIYAALGPGGASWGLNLIHSPQMPDMEEQVVDLCLSRGVTRISASAFMNLRPSVVRFACQGLTRTAAGRAIRRTYVFAKVSRPEVATQFMSPPPVAMLEALRSAGHITADEAAIAATIPVAEDITAEADSGGHTDNRPLTVLLPRLLQLRNEIARELPAATTIRVGAAGGIATPNAAAAAFALGASYILTGSINQMAVESGVSPLARAMLANADIADTVMAPAADMFELGVKVQVLRKGTMFAQRAGRLYEIYRSHKSLDDIPVAARTELERDVFRKSLEEVWIETQEFYKDRDPSALTRAQQDAHHKMALLFCWYLGLSSRWPVSPDEARRLDFQLWAGPAIGAFNSWTKGSFLAVPEQRTVAQIALNLLEGAAIVARAQQARSYGIDVPTEAFSPPPRPIAAVR